MATDLHFTCGLAATLLGLPVARSGALRVLTRLAWLLTGPAGRHPSPPVGELLATITRGHACPRQNGSDVLGLSGEAFSEVTGYDSAESLTASPPTRHLSFEPRGGKTQEQQNNGVRELLEPFLQPLHSGRSAHGLACEEHLKVISTR